MQARTLISFDSYAKYNNKYNWNTFEYFSVTCNTQNDTKDNFTSFYCRISFGPLCSVFDTRTISLIALILPNKIASMKHFCSFLVGRILAVETTITATNYRWLLCDATFMGTTHNAKILYQTYPKTSLKSYALLVDNMLPAFGPHFEPPLKD